MDLLELLYSAYRDARCHKRNTAKQLAFEMKFENELFGLKRDLENRTYELAPSICFINEKPVKREIIAASFRDRVVHHLLCNWICPIFDRQFIYDCYSCRDGKGTDFAIKRARHFIVSESRNYTRECYALRLDISGFFMSIDRDILYNLVIESLERAKWKDIPDKEMCIFLIQKIIYNNPLENAVFRSPASAWKDLPQNKSLRHTVPNCGLPIGNLTSQWFGNVYLNKLDHYVQHQLKIHCYGRYVDDMLLVHHDKEALKNAVKKIDQFLKERLRLKLQKKKTKLQPIEKGFPLLGAYILPWRVYPSRRTVKNFRECVHHPVADENKQDSRVQSYLGYMSHYNARHLTQKILGEVS